MGLFHALGLISIRESCPALTRGPKVPPLDTRRVVLLVPEAGLSLLRAFHAPEVFLSISDNGMSFDNHFISVHAAYVQVRRGRALKSSAVVNGAQRKAAGGNNGDHKEDESDQGGSSNSEGNWRYLNDHLCVRDARADDANVELMVSAVVPGVSLTFAPFSKTFLQLRPCNSVEMVHAPKQVQRRMGGAVSSVFYSASLDDMDRTAIIVPHGGSARSSAVADSAISNTASSSPSVRLACPDKAVMDRRQVYGPSSKEAQPSAVFPKHHRVVYGQCAVDQSMELVSDAKNKLVQTYRIKTIMANEQAKQLITTAGVTPAIQQGVDPCSVRISLRQTQKDNPNTADITYDAHFPFPVNTKAAHVKFSRQSGFVSATIPTVKCSGDDGPPLSIADQGFAAARTNTSVPLSWCFPSCAPLSTLPRLNPSSEWAHKTVSWESSYDMEEGGS